MRLRSIMGKRRQRAALVVCALLLALLLFAVLRPRTAQAGLRARQAAEGLDRYDFQLIFRPESNELSIGMTLSFTNRTGDTLNDLTLRTWAGAYEREETSPAAIDALFAACYPQSFSAASLTPEGAWWNGALREARFADAAHTVLTVLIDPLAPGESGRLELRCLLRIPACAHRLGVSQGIWQFGNALPILAVYDNHGWRTDPYSPIGDPFVSLCANYTVELTVPAGYVCASTGRCLRDRQDADSWHYAIDAPATRDFAFALSQGWQTAASACGGIQVYAYAPTRACASRAAKDAAQALRVYQKLYGDYPYETLTLCAVDFPFGGMEYPGLMFVGLAYCEDDLADTLELVIAHETAHQWFYALVGSDQVSQPWQDEALCEYAMLRYVREIYGQSAYQNLVITRVTAPMRERIAQPLTPATPIADFGSLDAYTSVVYGRGAAFLLAVEEMTGKLDAFLRSYCDAFAFSMASRQDFERLLNAVTGEDLTPLALDYLDTLMQ